MLFRSKKKAAASADSKTGTKPEKENSANEEIQVSKKKAAASNEEVASLPGEGEESSPPNPRVLLAEAIGSQAVSLAKMNTALKISVAALSLSTVAAVAMAASVWHKETEYRYFFMDSNGTILENQPLSDPALSLNMVRDFYAESLSHLFSFHYRNFGMHYQRLAPDIMTERAMLEFSREIDRIGLVQTMEERREVAEAVITQTPVLNSSGVDPNTGLYTWELSVPFNLRLESGRSERSNIRRMQGVVRVQIIRVQPTVHPRRILINRITIRDTPQ